MFFFFCAAYNKHIFTVDTCEDDTQIQITLTGGALSAVGQVKGIYVKSDPVNGKLTWIQTSNSTALWWSYGYWIIGSMDSIGTSMGWLANPMPGPPYGIDNFWSYYNYNADAWVNPIDEINVELKCTTESGKLILLRRSHTLTSLKGRLQ
jgi:hypothetical protein